MHCIRRRQINRVDLARLWQRIEPVIAANVLDLIFLAQLARLPGIARHQHGHHRIAGLRYPRHKILLRHLINRESKFLYQMRVPKNGLAPVIRRC